MSKSIKRILLVEDELESQIIIELLLNRHPSQIDIVSDGLTALQKACPKSYDCIFMDLGLPKLGGIQAFMTIKDVFKTRALILPPVIAMTEFINYPLIEQCFELGMVSVLFKPLKERHIDQLFARLAELEKKNERSNHAPKNTVISTGHKPILKSVKSDSEPCLLGVQRYSSFLMGAKRL
ncbi:Autoinducer 2 sensor kinase/phosphatase LuxQ [Legionella massiliensis]|uniref:Autoinducer 2 sensor kinase/phosphatase LuxQ n=1 Tax=Legionella massiliensis TaxID=1034943 RepID=A0A078KYE2_9GAMM|nr:response regulator [Legionella massiliensis]CDZ76794.1 Autoinducer 2 sensor kinase/phosphatase LuxQ [Legionella massiliensis]CEE12532.1 Autoinducer 2 sensor kinase/phosphatase LuxQ [Legionella massiliensis]